MSNRATLQRTKFEDIPSGEVSYGWRLYDDYANCYNNTHEEPPPDDDMEFLKMVMLEMTEQQGEDILDHVVENESGIHIGNTYYDYAQIQPIINPAKNFSTPCLCGGIFVPVMLGDDDIWQCNSCGSVLDDEDEDEEKEQEHFDHYESDPHG